MAEQEQTVLGWLADKSTAHGFSTALWTARRVADLIRRRFGMATGRLLHCREVIEFLLDVLKHLRGNVVVVWDRGGNHKGPVIRKFLPGTDG